MTNKKLAYHQPYRNFCRQDQVTGGEDRVYLFVKGGEKAFKVKKGSYRENFRELYSDCPQMLEQFQGEKIRWDDVALHIYAYNELCK